MLVSIDEAIDKFGKVAARWPWTQTVAVLGAGFLTATVVSTAISYFAQPNLLKESKRGPVASSILPSSLSDASFTGEDVAVVVDRNVFNIDGEVPKDEAGAKIEAKPVYVGDEAIKSTLPFKLHGTIFGGDPKSGLAVIEDTGRKSMNSFMVGQTLKSGVTLIEIWRERIILDLGDHKEYIKLERKTLAVRQRGKGKRSQKKLSKPRYASDPPPEVYKEEGFERSGTDIKLSKDFRKKLLTVDFAKVLQDAKAEPHFINGELSGFRLNRIRSDSIYEKAGLRNDDIIREVNGVPLTDVAQSIKLLNSLRAENEIEVRLERAGKPQTVTLQVQ